MLTCTFARFWSHSSAYEPRKMSSAGLSGDGQDKFRWEGSLEAKAIIYFLTILTDKSETVNVTIHFSGK